MTLNVDSPKVYTVEGVPISVTGIAQVSCAVISFLDLFPTVILS